MPLQPPRIGGAAKRKAWAPAPGRRDTRKRGRAGQRDRAQVLAEEPLCRPCLTKSRTAASTIVDHIVPLAWGGTDSRGNKQGICEPCHDEKSKAERAIDAGQRRRFE